MWQVSGMCRMPALCGRFLVCRMPALCGGFLLRIGCLHYVACFCIGYLHCVAGFWYVGCLHCVAGVCYT